mgnify:CR=1 FL=1
MSRVRTVFANMSWLMFSQIITSVCAFVWTILTARYLGVSDYGLLGTATSFATIFGVCADLSDPFLQILTLKRNIWEMLLVLN